MTKSEIDWRLSDAPDIPKKDDVQSVTEHASAGPNPDNPQQEAEPLPIVEIRYPKRIEDDARAYKRRQQRRDRWKVFLEALTVVGVLAYGAIAHRQWHAMLAANDNSAEALQTTERAYVTFGSGDGLFADFGSVTTDNKPIIILHFLNSGRSVARHFAVNVETNIDRSGSELSYRHRFKRPGDIRTDSPANESDIAGGAEQLVYVTDPTFLKTKKELADASIDFFLFGNFAYCDIFGGYHCQGFMARYRPAPVGGFIPETFLKCVPSEPSRANLRWYANNGYKEIEPCEQPNEPEYIKAEPPLIASTPSATP